MSQRFLGDLSRFAPFLALLVAGCGGQAGQNPPPECSEIWREISIPGETRSRLNQAAVWTGAELLIWGGQTVTSLDVAGEARNDGLRVDPVSGDVASLSLDQAPAPRIDFHGVWTGARFLVTGGLASGQYVEGGGEYDPETDTWVPMSDPELRRYKDASVWTGRELILWGGPAIDEAVSVTGDAYSPETRTWRKLSLEGAPSGYESPFMLWTGDEVLVWGYGEGGLVGGRYLPSSDTWAAISAPPRTVGGAVAWTGQEVLFWGGEDYTPSLRYSPETDTWSELTFEGAPSSRRGHTVSWVKGRMLVYGGVSVGSPASDVAAYDPETDRWSSIPTDCGPPPRSLHTATVAGDEVIIWGGVEDVQGDSPVPPESGWVFTPPW